MTLTIGCRELASFEPETFHAGPWMAYRDGSELVPVPVFCWCGMDPHPCGACIAAAREG